MSLNTASTSIKKQLFHLKPIGRDGLLLKIHHTSQDATKQVLRFIQACFNNTGDVMAIANHRGDVFIVDLRSGKYWIMRSFSSCTVLKYSTQNEQQLIVGVNGGNMYVGNSETGDVLSNLFAHSESVLGITFSTDYQCLSYSKTEAILWDMENYSKLRMLNSGRDSAIKEVVFMPVTNYIVGYYQEDVITIWNHKTLEVVKQIVPTAWEKFSVKSITFTRNGRAMIIGGSSSQLVVYLFDVWSVAKIIKLADDCKAVKRLELISQPFDGGCNRVLTILGTNGILYFYNMDTDQSLTEIKLEIPIKRFEISINGKYLVCILNSGEINVFNLATFTGCKSSTSNESTGKDNSRNFVLPKRSSSIITNVKKKLGEMLEIDKLKLILREFNEYPEAYRVKIWTQLLKLPNNTQQYNALLNGTESIASVEQLGSTYPLENVTALKNLKKVVASLISWCPFFDNVEYLPIFVFPFVKVFKNDPIICFEAVLSIIVNWCQFWFEYHPLPPINTLAMIENILLEHDPQLLNHLVDRNINSQLYAWPFLETAFSETLTSHDWHVFWDHVLTNEPAFLLFSVVAYNLLLKQTILSLVTTEQFTVFYHHQSPMEMKRFLGKVYHLMETTSEVNQPRQYLEGYKGIEAGFYPKFAEFPRANLDSEMAQLKEIRRENDKLVGSASEELGRVQREELDKLKEFQRTMIENERLNAMECVFKEQTLNDRKHIESQCKKLETLRSQLQREQHDLIQITKDGINEKIARKKTRRLDRLLEEKRNRVLKSTGGALVAEKDLLNNYWYLSKLKLKIEQLINDNDDDWNETYSILLEDHEKELSKQINLAQDAVDSKKYLKELNIATGLNAMDQLMGKIELEIKKTTSGLNSTKRSETMVTKLTSETIELQKEVDNLMGLLKPA